MERLKHVALLYTYNRPELLGRSIRCWLEQEYTNKQLCIFNNGNTDIILGGDMDSNISNQGIRIVNSNKDIWTGEPFNNLGTIYMNGLHWFAEELSNSTFVTMWQDDDMYLSHFLNSCNELANYSNLPNVYKTREFIFHDKGNKISKKDENNVEGSWIVDIDFLMKTGFAEPSMHPETLLHAKLKDNVNYIKDSNAKPSYIYEWNNGVYHSSGGINNPNNFNIYRQQNNKEEKVIEVWSKQQLMNYYKENNLLQWIQ